MSIDCKIILPHTTRGEEIGEVVWIAAGLPFKWESHSHSGGTFHSVRIAAEPVTPSKLPGLSWLRFKGSSVDDDDHQAVIHHDYWDGKLVSARGTPFWIAIGIKLVDFFGGWIDYRDDDDSFNDYQKEPVFVEEHDDKELFQAFHDALRAIKPITKEEFALAVPLSAYGDEE